MIGFNAAGVAVRSDGHPRVWTPFRGDPIPEIDQITGSSGSHQADLHREWPVVPGEHRYDWREDRRLFREYPVGPGAETVRLFVIGALAVAAGRKSTAVRKWIRTGVIPDASFRTQGIPGTLSDAGRRLWTQEQIETIVRIGTEEGVVGRPRPRSMADSCFVERVRDAWVQNGW